MEAPDFSVVEAPDFSPGETRENALDCCKTGLQPWCPMRAAPQALRTFFVNPSLTTTRMELDVVPPGLKPIL